MRRVLLWLLAMLPFVIGYAAGVLIALALIVWAAFMEGYTRGIRR